MRRDEPDTNLGEARQRTVHLVEPEPTLKRPHTGERRKVIRDEPDTAVHRTLSKLSKSKTSRVDVDAELDTTHTKSKGDAPRDQSKSRARRPFPTEEPDTRVGGTLGGNTDSVVEEAIRTFRPSTKRDLRRDESIAKNRLERENIKRS